MDGSRTTETFMLRVASTLSEPTISGFFLFRRHNYNHSLAFQFGWCFWRTYFFQVLDEPFQNLQTSVLEHNCPADKVNVCFDFCTFFEEIFGMPGFELKIVVVRVGAEADFFQNGFNRLGFHFFFFPLLFVKEFFEIGELAYRRGSVRGDFDEVEVDLVSPNKDFAGRNHGTGFNFFADFFADFFQVVTNEAYFWNTDLFVHPELRPPVSAGTPSSKITFCQIY